MSATTGVDFNSVVSSTLHDYLSTQFSQQVFNGLILFKTIIDKGRKQLESGGDILVEPILTEKAANVQWMAPYDTLAASPQDSFTVAKYNWSMLGAAIPFSEFEQNQNSGKQQIINLLNAKVEQLRQSVVDQLNSALFADGTTPNSLTGLKGMVSDSSTFAGIDPTATGNSYWKAYLDSTTTTLSEADMRTAFNTTGRNLQRPDLIVTSRALFEKFETLIGAKYQQIHAGTGELGFDGLAYKSATVVYDDYCDSDRMYFINSDRLKLRVHRDADMTPSRKQPTNQFLDVLAVRWLGQLTTDSRRHFGVLTNRS